MLSPQRVGALLLQLPGSPCAPRAYAAQVSECLMTLRLALAFFCVGVISYRWRNRRQVFNLPRLHVLAETFPSTTGVFLHYSCQAWISASGKAFSPRRQGNLNGCFILSVTRFLFQGILTLFLSVCCKELFHVTFKSKHSVLNYK